MKITWKFFAGFFLGLAAIVSLFYFLVLLQLGAKTETSRWAAEIIAKKTKAALALTEPKLVVVGGSASHFGVNAAELEKLTGMPCVNGASFAGLGPVYLLETGKRMLKPGDTALLILEYEMFLYDAGGKTFADENLIDFIFARDPAYFRQLGWAEKFRFINSAPINRVKRGIRSRDREEERWENTGVYRADLLNGNGDQQGHLRSARPLSRVSADLLNMTLSKGLIRTNVTYPHVKEFCDWARAHQIRVIAAFPNLAEHPQYTTAQIDEITRAVRYIFGQFQTPVIGSAAEAIYPRDMFFDTMYHLTYEGSLIRSTDLARQLKPLLTSPSNAL